MVGYWIVIGGMISKWPLGMRNVWVQSVYPYMAYMPILADIIDVHTQKMVFPKTTRFLAHHFFWKSSGMAKATRFEVCEEEK